LARSGEDMAAIRDYIDKRYYPMDFALDEIREGYKFSEACRDTVPQAITAFLESTPFEDAIRGAVSLGGDSDTVAAVAGGIAEAYWGAPAELRALGFLDDRLLKILQDFEAVYPPSKADRKIGA
jgi:type I restriction enzyme M protein